MNPDRLKRIALTAGAVGLVPLTAGCISVKTPEKPIEINLNVKIEQEVLVRLQRDVDQLIRENPDVFPQQQPSTGGTPR